MLRLDWRAPSGCPTRADVLAHVATLAQGERLRWDRFEMMRGAIARAGSRWSLALEFVARAGVRKRTLASGRCSELAEAAAVAIVLAHRSSESDEHGSTAGSPAPDAARDTLRTSEATDALWAAEPTDTRTASEAPGAVTSEPSGSPPQDPLASDPVAGEPGSSPPPADAGASNPTLSLGAQAALDPTTLGSAAFGASVDVALGLGPFALGLYGAGFPSTATRLGAAQSIELGLWTGGLRGCYRWGRGLDSCASMELGQLTAEGVGLRSASQSSDLWAAPGLSVGFTSTPFDGFGITTRIAAFHPLVRGRYRVDDTDVVHHVPGIGFRATLGIDLPLL